MKLIQHSNFVALVLMVDITVLITIVLLSWAIPLGLSACGLSGGAEEAAVLEPVSLKLNWYHSVQFLGFYVAQSRGFYQDEGLDVTIIPRADDDVEIPESVAAGVYDFSVGGTIQYAQRDGDPVVAIAAMYQFGPEAFFAHADAGINTPRDLAGHSVVVKSPGWEWLLVKLLEHDGLTLDDVEVVDGGFDMTPFFERKVDVWAGFLNHEVVIARMAGVDVVTLPLHEYGIVTVAEPVATSANKIAQHPEQIERFLRASLRGWEWALDHPEDAVDIMIALYPDLAQDRAFHIASFDALIPVVRPPGAHVGAIDCDIWVQDERLTGLEATDGLCTTEFLERIWEQGG